MVQIYQRQAANSAARQCFCRPGADSAHAHDGYVGRTYAPGSLKAVQTLQPAKAALEIYLIGHGSRHLRRARRSLAAPAASDCG